MYIIEIKARMKTQPKKEGSGKATIKPGQSVKQSGGGCC